MRKKFELNQLKVNSFVTALDKSNEQTIKGGANPAIVSATALGFGIVLGFIVTTLPLAGAIVYDNKVKRELNESNEKNDKGSEK